MCLFPAVAKTHEGHTIGTSRRQLQFTCWHWRNGYVQKRSSLFCARQRTKESRTQMVSHIRKADLTQPRKTTFPATQVEISTSCLGQNRVLQTVNHLIQHGRWAIHTYVIPECSRTQPSSGWGPGRVILHGLWSDTRRRSSKPDIPRHRLHVLF